MKLKSSIPTLPVYDVKKAVDFYKSKFGFSCPHEEKTFARLVRDEVEIHLWAACNDQWKLRSVFLFLKPITTGAESFLVGTASCRIEVETIDALYEEYKKSGVLYDSNTVVEKTTWGTREFAALDLHRNLLTFYERV
ncbi:MAG: VOC family protein [Ignavibacteriae bacterium]|nr:VOC family protein [Ignavibacteriota bacterium]